MPSPAPIRVLLAAPEPLLRDGLVCLPDQRPETEVAGEATALDGVVIEAERCAAEVALVDADLLGAGEGQGVEGAEGRGGQARRLRIVALMKERPAEQMRRRVPPLLESGVAGFVTTKDDAATVFEAVAAAARGGEVYLSPRVASRLARGRRALGAGDVGTPRERELTPREREVLRLAALGRSNARIAAELGLAPGTVRNHLSAVYGKLHASSRAEAVAWAWCYGHVQPTDFRGGAAPKGGPPRGARADPDP